MSAAPKTMPCGFLFLLSPNRVTGKRPQLDFRFNRREEGSEDGGHLETCLRKALTVRGYRLAPKGITVRPALVTWATLLAMGSTFEGRRRAQKPAAPLRVPSEPPLPMPFDIHAVMFDVAVQGASEHELAVLERLPFYPWEHRRYPSRAEGLREPTQGSELAASRNTEIVASQDELSESLALTLEEHFPRHSFKVLGGGMRQAIPVWALSGYAAMLQALVTAHPHWHVRERDPVTVRRGRKQPFASGHDLWLDVTLHSRGRSAGTQRLSFPWHSAFVPSGQRACAYLHQAVAWPSSIPPVPTMGDTLFPDSQSPRNDAAR